MCPEYRIPANNPFYGCELRILLPDDKTLVREKVRAASNSLERHLECVDQLATVLGWPLPDDATGVEAMLSVADKVVKAPPHAGVKSANPNG